MAEMLNDYKWGRKGNAKYPWDLWLDGNVWKLTKGTDFNCAVESMRLGAVAKAKRIGMRLNVESGEDYVIIQAVKKE